MADNDGTLSRRDALKTTAKVAGVAAFATPVVMGVFSGSAGAFDRCDPSVDSDAIDLLQGNPKRWNINCDAQNTFAGRYNAQRTTSIIPGTTQSATLNFGALGVDNFPVECSFYTIEAPAGWDCTATFRVEKANGAQGCTSPGAQEATSTPGQCTDGFPSYPDFSPPAGAQPLPYCYVPGGKPNACDSGVKLALVSWYCCPPA